MRFFPKRNQREARRDDGDSDERVQLLEAEMRNIMQEFDQLKADFAALTAAHNNLKSRLDANAAASVPAADVAALSNDVKGLTAHVDSLAPLAASATN